MKVAEQRAHVRHVLSSMPRLRSGLNPRDDGPGAWTKVVLAAAISLKDVVLSENVELNPSAFSRVATGHRTPWTPPYQLAPSFAFQQAIDLILSDRTCRVDHRRAADLYDRT